MFSSLSSVYFVFLAKFLPHLHLVVLNYFLITGASIAAASPPHLPSSPTMNDPLDVSAAYGHAANRHQPSAIDFSVVIPAILRLVKNDHPTELHALAGTPSLIYALQRVVLVSTMRSGFCMDLRLNPMRDGQAKMVNWQVNLTALSGAATATARVEVSDSGWRVCSRRAGRFELALRHAFSFQPYVKTPAANAPSEDLKEISLIGWPVALSLTTP